MRVGVDVGRGLMYMRGHHYMEISIHSGISPTVGFNASPGSITSHDDQLQTGVSKNRRADQQYIKHVMMAYIGAWGRRAV